ncbi:MAG: CbiX/SirB N-terminal domain-containing protein, partial [Dermabacter sp.]|nr:CbiX/SirB N-terminal domain-containing protein [Dermabacter sp.]
MTLSNAPALIGIAHGSRNPDAAAVTESLVSAAGARLGIEAHAAYLEDFASPSITEVAKMLAEHGYSSAVAVPLLFTEAYHATEDA